MRSFGWCIRHPRLVVERRSWHRLHGSCARHSGRHGQDFALGKGLPRSPSERHAGDQRHGLTARCCRRTQGNGVAAPPDCRIATAGTDPAARSVPPTSAPASCRWPRSASGSTSAERTRSSRARTSVATLPTSALLVICIAATGSMKPTTRRPSASSHTTTLHGSSRPMSGSATSARWASGGFMPSSLT